MWPVGKRSPGLEYFVLYRVCHGHRLMMRVAYCWANFDPFWSKHIFLMQLGQYWKLAWAKSWTTIWKLSLPKSVKSSVKQKVVYKLFLCVQVKLGIIFMVKLIVTFRTKLCVSKNSICPKCLVKLTSEDITFESSFSSLQVNLTVTNLWERILSYFKGKYVKLHFSHF